MTSGVLIDGRTALGFRRLSILDLSSAGHQPMTSSDGTLSIVFNGEIYNYLELRAELQRAAIASLRGGHGGPARRVRAVGRRCSIARRHVRVLIVDRRTSTLFVARDRLGIKPFYVVRPCARRAVRLRAQADRGPVNGPAALNTARFAQFLARPPRACPTARRRTSTGCNSSRPATRSRSASTARASTNATGRRPDEQRERTDDAPRFLALFDDAVKLHMRSDLPVGVMLSGGMDSVSIACTMAQLACGANTGQALHAFCYLSEDFEESVQLDDTIAQTGATMHRVATVEADTFWVRLREAMWYHDEPVHSPSVLMGFELYRIAAANGIRVVLSGQGADETIGGYEYFFDHMLVTEALRGRLPTLLEQARICGDARGRSRDDMLLRCARLARAHLLSRFAGYRRFTASRRLAEGRGLPYLAPEFGALASPAIEEPPGQTLGIALERAVRQSPLPHYLRVEDRNSMAHSVESRVPFLDHRLVEQGMALPARWKMFDGWNKRVLREAMRGRIPESVRLRRRKLGFPTSARRWFAGPLADGLRDIVRDGARDEEWLVRSGRGRTGARAPRPG